jgi:hypothetical protein
MGRDEYYPTTVLTAKSLLVTFKMPTKTPANRSSEGQHTQPLPSPKASAMTFVLRSALVAGMDSSIHEGIQCWTCQQQAYYAGKKCPTSALGGMVSGTTLMQHKTKNKPIKQVKLHAELFRVGT